MNHLNLYKKDLELLISKELIHNKLSAIAEEINSLYKSEELTVIGVLKGSFCLTADLIRLLEMPVCVEFIQAKSYGLNGVERGELSVEGVKDLSIKGKHVLIIDDILDTGNTLAAIIQALKVLQPLSLKSLVLLNKKIAVAKACNADYCLFDIEDRFVIGYGMDYCEYYRELDGIYTKKGI